MLELIGEFGEEFFFDAGVVGDGFIEGDSARRTRLTTMVPSLRRGTNSEPRRVKRKTPMMTRAAAARRTRREC